MDGRTRHRGWFLATCVSLAAATGAVTVSLGVDAGGTSTSSTYVPMVPCRLFDTRPAPFTVGDRMTPLGPDETLTQQVTGDVGNCSVPADAVSVAINITAVDGTAPSFLTVTPAGGDLPIASTVNWLPGEGPAPNQIDATLSAGGAIDVYNAFGTVHVIGDVVGYSTPSDLAEHEQRLDQLDTEIASLASEFETLDDAVSAKPGESDVYLRPTLDAVLPAAAGWVESDGSAFAASTSFGLWTVSRPSTGLYLITLLERGTCVGTPVPIALVTPIELAGGLAVGSCNSVTGNSEIFVYTRRLDNGNSTDAAFQFVVYDS